MKQSLSRFNILIVDDTTKNIQIVARVLKDENYLMAFATNGADALDQINATHFDLILLDIMMPGMDGFQVCEKLKSDPATRDIPIIFLSARSDTEDIVKGFELGAVDYLTKPFKHAELVARVKTHLALKAAKEEIEQQRALLERQNRDLTEMARLRDDIEQITNHDLKSPLNAVINIPDLIGEISPITEKQQSLLNSIKDSGYAMLNMINNSLNLVKMERGIYDFSPLPVNAISVLKRVKTELLKIITKKNLTFKILIDSREIAENEKFIIPAEELLTYSMLSNLLKNAAEASPAGEQITVELEKDSGESIIKIHNSGTVPELIKERFFEKYTTYGKGNSGTGLGTYSAKLIAMTQNAKITMNSSEEKGTVITITFPALSQQVSNLE